MYTYTDRKTISTKGKMNCIIILTIVWMSIVTDAEMCSCVVATGAIREIRGRFCILWPFPQGHKMRVLLRGRSSATSRLVPSSPRIRLSRRHAVPADDRMVLCMHFRHRNTYYIHAGVTITLYKSFWELRNSQRKSHRSQHESAVHNIVMCTHHDI